MKTKKTLLISICCGLSAIILSAFYLDIKEREVAGGGELQTILVAVSNIKQNTLLEPGLVKKKNIPRAFIQPGALKSWREAAGRVSLAEIKSGEQLLQSKLILAGPKTGLSAKIQKGNRAVSLSLKEEDVVAGLISPDDYVDVVATFDYGDSDQSDKYTYSLFQNIQVLAVDSKMHSIRNPEGIVVVEKESNDLFGSSPKISHIGGNNKVITLSLNPDEVGQLIFAREAGKITLALRSPMDRTVGESKTVKAETLTGRAGFTRKKL